MLEEGVDEWSSKDQRFLTTFQQFCATSGLWIDLFL
jgi:hypothetical protein